jgi:hypothetical protein
MPRPGLDADGSARTGLVFGAAVDDWFTSLTPVTLYTLRLVEDHAHGSP